MVACTNSGGGSGPANSPAEAPSTFPSPVTSTVMSSRLPSEPFDGVESCKDAQADTASDESIASSSDEETWTDNHRSVDSCEDYRVARWAEVYEDPHGPKRVFGYDGYLFRRVAIRRTIGGEQRTHCVRVYHPRERSREGKKVRVSEWIGPSWYRLIENSLNRLPWHHLQVVHAFVIDDRPILHGVASFSREDPSHDARDGHTIWLNKRLFLEPNGWGPGNYGKYWAYRVNRDGQRAHGQVPEHDLFSPVLLHEVGHLVNYSVVNGSAADPSCPPCAYMCGDHKNCAELKPAQREAFCVTSYCTGFGYASGTENFAEMYRWFYQGRETRELLEQHFEPCHRLLESSNGAWKAPWDNGMGEISSYRKTLWDSCDGTACRAW
ncbi:MAG: hypothetical protein BWY17_00664 [Deltaproteobacteria bacterium ADurb.Bin207]|nr:MAG: hypothetical protein BWY17_00664 [Deltaproteobacteria bacterium ADurb.Bin207]